MGGTRKTQDEGTFLPRHNDGPGKELHQCGAPLVYGKLREVGDSSPHYARVCVACAAERGNLEILD